MDIWQNLFTGFSTNQSWEILGWLLLFLLLGLLLGYLIWGTRIGRLRTQLKAANNTISEWEKKYADLQAQLELRDADLQKANLEIEELSAKSRLLQNEKGQLHGELMTAQGDIEKYKTAQTNWEKQSLDFNTKIDGLNNQILGLQTKNNALAASANTDVNADLQKEIGNLKSKLKECRSRVDGFEDELEINAKFTSALEKENLELQNKLNAQGVLQGSASPTPISKEEAASKAQAEVKAALGSKITAATADDKDDLKRISGVGPFIEKKLNNLGIYTYEQVSQFDASFIQQVTDAIQFFPGRIDRDDWVGQAKNLQEKKLAGTLEVIKKHPSNVEDLKIVEGIGPKIEQLLKNDDINTWNDLANASQERLQRILSDAGDRFRMHRPDSWPEQATLAVQGKWDELEKLQDFLIGGKDLSKG